MALFMDRHLVLGASFSDMESAHEADLKIQDAHGVKFLTYWFDSRRGNAFCLTEAPTEEAVRSVHQKAHGNLPAEIIEVDLSTVESFLGPWDDKGSTSTDHSDEASAFRAILFTDLKDSTTMSMVVGDTRAMELLELHNEIIRAELHRHRGREVKHTGDGLMTSFASVTDSVSCAIAIQRRFKSYNDKHPDATLRVRIGINAGEPVERSGDLFGLTVQLASRVCDSAAPDQVLVSGIIREFCESGKMREEFRDAGRVKMKGFPSAVQLYEVGWQ